MNTNDSYDSMAESPDAKNEKDPPKTPVSKHNPQMPEKSVCHSATPTTGAKIQSRRTMYATRLLSAPGAPGTLLQMALS